MKLDIFQKNKQKAVLDDRTKNYAIWGLLALALMQQWKINVSHEVTKIIPPHLTRAAQIGWDSASQEYWEQMGLFIVNQIANTTPATADYNIKTLAQFFDIQVWNSLKPSLLAIKNDKSYDNSNPISTFLPNGGIIYEPETQTYFFSGRLISSAYRNRILTQVGAIEATYELKFKMNNGLPLVTSFYSYEGKPKTLVWAQQNQTAYTEEQQKRKQNAVRIENKPLLQASKVKEPDNTKPLPVNDAVDALDLEAKAASGISGANGMTEVKEEKK